MINVAKASIFLLFAFSCTHEITQGSRWTLSPEIMASRLRALPSIVTTCATGYRAVNGKLRYNFIFRQCQMGSI